MSPPSCHWHKSTSKTKHQHFSWSVHSASTASAEPPALLSAAVFSNGHCLSLSDVLGSHLYFSVVVCDRAFALLLAALKAGLWGAITAGATVVIYLLNLLWYYPGTSGYFLSLVTDLDNRLKTQQTTSIIYNSLYHTIADFSNRWFHMNTVSSQNSHKTNISLNPTTENIHKSAWLINCSTPINSINRLTQLSMTKTTSRWLQIIHFQKLMNSIARSRVMWLH